jgi:hypothetical protein
MSWSEHSYRIAGQRVCLRASCPEFLREFRRIFRAFPLRRGGASAGLQHYEIERGDGYVLRKGRRLLFRCQDLDDAVEFLESEVYSQLVRLLDGRLLFHAAAAVRQGTLILLPAASGGGKTTLVTGLVKRGCRYLTDEMLILHPSTLSVRPFPKPLNLKYGSLALFPRLEPELRPARRGPLANPRQRIHHLLVRPQFRQRGSLRAPRLAILFPSYQPEARAEMQTLDRVETVRRLAAACYNHYRFGPRFLSCAERLTRGALCATLTYGRLEEALEVIDRQVVALAPAPELTAAFR